MAEMKENMAPATAPPARTSDIAVIGLAVMGQNLILNMNDNGFVVTAYNRTTAKVDEFLANEAKGTKIVGAHSIEEMCATLKAPRRIMLLVKAGAPVDQFIEAVLPHTEPGDILIDGGNSLFSDTIRRTAHVEAQGRLFIGTGVSGGEEGARTGPSIMPGGRCRVLLPPPFHRHLYHRLAHLRHLLLQRGGVAARQADLPSDLREGGQGRRAVLPVGRRRRRRPLRQDGAQRDRVRRHAADLRGVPADGVRPRDGLRRDGRGVLGVEQGRAAAARARRRYRRPSPPPPPPPPEPAAATALATARASAFAAVTAALATAPPPLPPPASPPPPAPPRRATPLPLRCMHAWERLAPASTAA